MTIINMGEIRQRHARFSAQLPMVFRDVFKGQTGKARRYVQNTRRFKHRTGALIKGVREQIITTKHGVKMRFTNEAPHAGWIEFGTKPHVIQVRKPAGAMTFFWEKVGARVFFKKVNHPGNRPYFFMRGAARHVFLLMPNQLQQMLEKLAKRF